jgi:hypothetical protein
MKLARVAILGLAVLSSGCYQTLDTTPEQVKTEISSALRPGASSTDIEAYFQGRGLEFSYDQYLSRYQAIIRHPKSNFHAITIHIVVDQQKRYVSVEAEDSYTFL